MKSVNSAKLRTSREGSVSEVRVDRPPARRMKRAGRQGDTWFRDAVYVGIHGERCCLRRAADQDGDTLDILVRRRRDRPAVLPQAAETTGSPVVPGRRRRAPRLRGGQARGVPCTLHDTKPYGNNRTEPCRQRTRERAMRRFKAPGQARRFLAVQAAVGNPFRLGGHLRKAVHYRGLGSAAFLQRREATCDHELTTLGFAPQCWTLGGQVEYTRPLYGAGHASVLERSVPESGSGDSVAARRARARGLWPAKRRVPPRVRDRPEGLRPRSAVVHGMQDGPVRLWGFADHGDLYGDRRAKRVLAE